jgi:octaprenyl-diphosphate synthase
MKSAVGKADGNALTLSLAELYAPIREELAQAQQIFDEELTSDLPFINGLCGTVRSYRGKMLRPGLLLLSAKACGNIRKEHAILAAVVEIVHMATLVHDDVLDQAEERRRRPTVAALSGNVTAVLIGDYLISHAFHLCSGLPDYHVCRRIGATTNTVCEGELMQNYLRGRNDLDEATYLEIIRRKTAALTATACELGAYCADAEPSWIEALRSYGQAVGLAFQIVDDCLDVTGDEATVGKTLGLDLAQGKLTLPTLHCLANAPREIRFRINRILADKEPCDRAQLRAWLAETGSLAYAISVAEGFVREACQRLDVLPETDAKASLSAMAEFITTRTF